MKPEPAFTAFDSRGALQAAAGDIVEQVLSEAINARGRAVLMASGGSTPGPVYQRLSTADLDWAKVTVGLADDRWVPADSDASNERLLRSTLLTHAGAEASFLPMKTSDDDPFEAVDEVDATYRGAASAIDLLLLGMGPDGHTLSWFAEARGLDDAMRPDGDAMVAAIDAPQTEVTGPHTRRMTLTANAVSSARHVLLLITGQEKRSIYETASPDLPVSYLRRYAGDRLTTLYAD